MKILILSAKGNKFFVFRKITNGFYTALNIIPRHLGIYIEVQKV